MFDPRWTFGDLRSFLASADAAELVRNAPSLLSLSLHLGRPAFAYAASVLSQYESLCDLADLFYWLGATDPLKDCQSLLESSLPDLNMPELALREVIISFLTPLLLAPLVPNVSRKMIVSECRLSPDKMMISPTVVYWPLHSLGYQIRLLPITRLGEPVVLSVRTVV